MRHFNDEHFPIGCADGALLADRQRNDDSRMRRLRQRGQDFSLQMGAQALHRVRQAGRETVQQACRRRGAGAYGAGGADAAFQQPQFVIEAIRIGIAMRALEPHRETPALARREFRQRGHARRAGKP
jgi:hypothetical protein